MRNLKIWSGILTTLIIVGACYEDDNIIVIDNTVSSLACEEAIKEYNMTNNGTICCLSGSGQVSPGATLTYEYHSNITDVSIIWEVISGSITIVGGQSSSTATFEFAGDFTDGIIVGRGESMVKVNGEPNTLCSESISVFKN